MEEKRRHFESEMNSLKADASDVLALPETVSEASKSIDKQPHEGN